MEPASSNSPINFPLSPSNVDEATAEVSSLDDQFLQTTENGKEIH